MARKAGEMPPVTDFRAHAVWRAADQIRAEGKERVALRNVRERVKRNAGKAGNYQCVGEHLTAWMADRQYSPIIELANMPEAVQTTLAKAGVELWKAAQAEAAAVLERDRVRMAEAIQAERDLRHEALGMLDARDLEISHLQDQLAWYVAELERQKDHVQTVRAREFWNRVAHEIWDVLPEREAMHVKDITLRIGADLVQEAEGHRQTWDVAAIRRLMDQRVFHGRLFASEGAGRYRRRRQEDVAA